MDKVLWFSENIMTFVLLFGAFMFYAVLWGRNYVHMLQLNSYFPKRYLGWLSENKNKMFLYKSLFLLVSVFFAFGKYNFWWALVFSIILVLSRPENKVPAKKPLVYTARVKRYFAFYIFFAAVILAIAILLIISGFKIWAIVFLTLAAFMIPFFVLEVLIITIPMEKAISRYYYNDAKKKIRSMKNLIVIGVTGSFGKTGTKYALSRLLSEKYNVLMTPGNFNTTLGVVKTIREHLKSTHDIFIVEMGAKNKGDIKEICDLVKPKYGIISSIGPQHLESFKTMENIVNTKFELADAVSENGGVMFLNYDNEYIRNKNFSGEKVTYGRENADVKISGINYSVSGTRFFVNGTPVQTKLLGEFNALNIGGACAVALHLGVEESDILVAIRQLEGTPHRLQLIKNARYSIIDDAYNSNPSGAKAALDVLSVFPERKILVTPGMVELGEKQYEFNKTFGRQAASKADYIVLVGEKQAGPIKEGVLEEGFSEERLYVAKDIGDALSYVNTITDVPSVVLLENDLPDNFL